MSKFNFHALGEQGVDYKITIVINDEIITFNNSTEEISFPFSEFKELSKDYNQQYGTGIKYYSRSIFKNFPQFFYKDKEVSNFIRIFLCSTNLLFRHSISNSEFDNFLKLEISDYLKKDNNDKSLFSDRLFIDWDGTDGVQPQFYFVSTDINNNKLENFFKLRMLDKLEISSGTTQKLFYYVPFEIPKLSKFPYFLDYPTWKRILNSIDDAVRNITGAKR